MDTLKGSWIDFLNGEAEVMLKLTGTLDRGLLRRVLTESLEEQFDFPFKAVFRCYVISSRSVDPGALPPEARRGDEPVRFLELVPAGYRPQSFEIMGGILVPCDRDLHPGSVVTVAVAFLDPTTYQLSPPGLLTELVDMDVQVAVEP